MFFLAVPGEPKRVRVEPVNSTAAAVEWRPPAPRDINGRIRGYQVIYFKIKMFFARKESNSHGSLL